MYRFSLREKLDADKRIKVDKRPHTQLFKLHSSAGLTRGGGFPSTTSPGHSKLYIIVGETEGCVLRVYLLVQESLTQVANYP